MKGGEGARNSTVGLECCISRLVSGVKAGQAQWVAYVGVGEPGPGVFHYL